MLCEINSPQLKKKIKEAFPNTFGVYGKAAKNLQELKKPKQNERRPLNYTCQHAVQDTSYNETNASNNTGSAVLAPHGALG